MAREAKGVVTGEVEYIPIVENNREDPDPFGVAMLPMTGAEVAEFERGAGDFTAGKINFTERAQKQVKELFTKKITRVWNYSIPHRKDPKTMIRPQNGVGLYAAIMEHGDATEAQIIDDIVKALKDHSHLREGLWETLRSRFDAPSTGMMSADGAASGVGALS